MYILCMLMLSALPRVKCSSLSSVSTSVSLDMSSREISRECEQNPETGGGDSNPKLFVLCLKKIALNRQAK